MARTRLPARQPRYVLYNRDPPSKVTTSEKSRPTLPTPPRTPYDPSKPAFSPDIPTNPQDASIFISKLPLEIRQSIYRFAFGGRLIHLYVLQADPLTPQPYAGRLCRYECFNNNHVTTWSHNCWFPWEHKKPWQAENLLALSLTCRLMYHESLPVLYNTSTFHVISPTALFQILTYTPKSYLTAIRSLKLFLDLPFLERGPTNSPRLIGPYTSNTAAARPRPRHLSNHWEIDAPEVCERFDTFYRPPEKSRRMYTKLWKMVTKLTGLRELRVFVQTWSPCLVQIMAPVKRLRSKGWGKRLLICEVSVPWMKVAVDDAVLEEAKLDGVTLRLGDEITYEDYKPFSMVPGPGGCRMGPMSRALDVGDRDFVDKFR